MLIGITLIIMPKYEMFSVMCIFFHSLKGFMYSLNEELHMLNTTTFILWKSIGYFDICGHFTSNLFSGVISFTEACLAAAQHLFLKHSCQTVIA